MGLYPLWPFFYGYFPFPFRAVLDLRNESAMIIERMFLKCGDRL